MTAVLALVLLSGSGGKAPVVHEDAVLIVPAGNVSAGDTLRLDGRDFRPARTYQVRLVGVLREHTLGSMRSDSAGRASMLLRIPAEIQPGFYQITATADDGDIVARVDLEVTPGPGEGQGPERTEESGVLRRSPGHELSADPRETGSDHVAAERSRGPLEWTAIVILLAASSALGVWAVRRRSVTGAREI